MGGQGFLDVSDPGLPWSASGPETREGIVCLSER